MLKDIDYTLDNPFKFIEEGEKISKKIITAQKIDKTNLIRVNSNYKASVGKKGIKDNLYKTLFTLLGDKKYNLLYEKFQDNVFNQKDNILLKFHKQIEKATTEEELINVYNSIYELYIQKLENTLKINQNIESDLDKSSKEIVELQENGLFDDKNKRYSNMLEQIINIYNERVQAYLKEIDKITENDIQKNLKEGKTREIAEQFAQRLPNMYKKELNKQQNRISIQREKQALQYKEIDEKTYKISTLQIRESNNKCINIK